jgi:hypothetical protein
MITRCLNEIEAGTLNVVSGDFVAFFGDDARLSDYLETVKSIGSRFQKIYFEGKDIADDDVDVLPIGLSEYYLRFQDWDVLSNLAETQDSISKEYKVLGAFGAFWPEVSNPSRTSAGDLCSSHGTDWWLTCGTVEKDQWWSTLRSYAYILNPTGNGVQSTKFYEALLARAVPIMTKDQPAFIELYEKGWPIVLVDSYTDVAQLNLTQTYEELRPKLAAIQPALHIDGYWNYLKTGNF